MKPAYFILIIALIAGCRQKSKYFTGVIDYKYSYTSDSLNVDSLAKARPDFGTMQYANVGYYSSFSRSGSLASQDELRYYYYGPSNKCLSRGRNTSYCEDYGIANDSVLSVRVYDTDEKVLGYACRIVEMQKKTSLVKYHISRKLKANPLTYKNHKAYNWDIYGKAANGGVILKVEHIFKLFTLHGIAVRLIITDDPMDRGLKEVTKDCL